MVDGEGRRFVHFTKIRQSNVDFRPALVFALLVGPNYGRLRAFLLARWRMGLHAFGYLFQQGWLYWYNS